jgi:hypothetical protein
LTAALPRARSQKLCSRHPPGSGAYAKRACDPHRVPAAPRGHQLRSRHLERGLLDGLVARRLISAAAALARKQLLVHSAAIKGRQSSVCFQRQGPQQPDLPAGKPAKRQSGGCITGVARSWQNVNRRLFSRSWRRPSTHLRATRHCRLGFRSSPDSDIRSGFVGSNPHIRSWINH